MSLAMPLRLYVQFVELDENKITEFLIEPNREMTIWKKPVSHLSGKNVELRFGVKGEGCESTFIRIIIYSTATPTTNTLTTAQTQTVTKTYVTTTLVTETHVEARGITLTAPATMYSTTTLTKTDAFMSTTTITMTNNVVQLPLFTIRIDVLQYISVIGALTVASGFSMLIYDGLRPPHERKTWRIALGFALPYPFFAGIFMWHITPLFFRPASLISVFVDYVNFMLILAFLVIFVIPLL